MHFTKYGLINFSLNFFSSKEPRHIILCECIYNFKPTTIAKLIFSFGFYSEIFDNKFLGVFDIRYPSNDKTEKL